MLTSSKILIKGGTVVNNDHQEVVDVYVEDGVIVSVRPNIKILLYGSSNYVSWAIKC